MRTHWGIVLCVLGAAGCSMPAPAANPPDPTVKTVATKVWKGKKVVKTEAEWKKILTPEQYRVLREKGTEPSFTGKYWNNHEKGVYTCAACGLELFKSDTKFESGTGWPSFWDVLEKGVVVLKDDNSLGDHRIEVQCARCGGHLGHVFDDGPNPTGQRYCMNSVSLNFVPAKKPEEKKPAAHTESGK